MNKIYRVIWNAKNACWTAVSELATAAGGSGASGVAAASVAAVLTLTLPLDSLASPAAVPSALPTGSNTAAYVAPNGVTVVNIATPNAAGVSHNQFTQYNVLANGMVLNNGDPSQMTRTSQLAGQVAANLNLSKSASLILNEVVSNNRSTLAGFTEVLGTQADVIIANPYGITCSGCGFINSPRVTITTGVAQLNPDGSMGVMKVGGGDILITGNGLNATNQQILDLVSRSVVLDGQVNAQDLGITTGANQWNYASRNVTGTATATGPAPARAIDSTLLGGMYANRIRLIATEAGAGVRMLGDAAASAAEFSLTSAGMIVVQSHLSAQTDLNLSSTDSSAQALQLSAASLSASQDINLAVSGGAVLDGGALVATRDLTLTAGALADTLSTSALSNNNQRYAGRNMTLAVADAATLDGTSWGSGQTLSGQFGSLSVGLDGATLYAGASETLATTNGAMSLGAALLKSTGDLNLSANGVLSTTSGVSQGIESTGGDVNLSATGGIANAGQISADTGSLTARVNGALINSGEMHAATLLDIADEDNLGTEAITNSAGGTMLSEATLRLQGAALTNATGAVIQSALGSTVRSDSLINQGTWLLSTQSGAVGGDLITVAGTLDNQGALQSARDLTLNAATLSDEGKILASGNLNADLSANLTNASNAALQAGQALNITGNAAVTNQANAKMLGNTLAISAASIDNAGTMQASSSSSVTASGLLRNEAGGVMSLATVSGGSATVNAGTLSNAGQLQSNGTLAANIGAGGLSDSGTMLSAGNLTVAAQNASPLNVTIDGVLGSINGATLIQDAASLTVNNHGQLFGNQLTASGQTMTVNSGALVSASNAMSLTETTLTDSGAVQAGGDLTATIGSGGLNDSGTLLAVGDISISGANPYALTVGGTLQSNGHTTVTNANAQVNNGGKLLGNLLTVNGPSLSVASGGLVNASGNMDLTLATLTNSGTVQASGNLSTAVSTALTNNSNAALHAGQALSISGNAALINRASANILGNTLAISAVSIDNAGLVQASGSSSVTASGLLHNEAGGVMSLATVSGGSATVNAGTLSNAGQLQSNGTLAANIGAGGLSDSGNLLAAGDLTLSGANPYALTVSGIVQGGGHTTVNNANVQVNSGGTLLGDLLTVNGPSLGVGSGGLVSAASNMDLTLTTLTDSGTVQAGGNLTAAIGSGGVNDSGALLAGADLTISGAHPYTLTVGGTLQGGGHATVSNANMEVGGSGKVLGNQLTVNGPSLVLDDGAKLISFQDMALTLGSLTLGGQNSVILAAANNSGNATISTGNAFSNSGAIHSGTNLTLTASSLTNGATGGISTGGDLTVNATSGDINNSGALYSGGNLAATATGTITNRGSGSGPLGTIDSGQAIALTAQTIVNNSAITAAGDITLSAATIHNDIYGGDTRTLQAPTTAVVMQTDHNDCTDCDGANRTQTWYYTSTYSQDQYYAGATATATKPTIIGGGTVTLKNFNTGTNVGGVISGNTVQLTGTGGSASFTNNPLTLVRTYYTDTYQHYIDYVAQGPLTYTDDSHHNSSVTTTTAVLPSIGAGIFATNLNATGFSLSNALTKDGAQSSKTATALTGPGGAQDAGLTTATGGNLTGATSTALASAAGGTLGTVAGGQLQSSVAAVAGANAITFGGLHLTLPTNPNGYYVIDKTPGAQYLVETNPLFGIGSSVGSSYLAVQLGYNPDQIGLRLGDSNYEAYLVQQQLIAQSGHNLIDGYTNLAQEMQGMMNSAVTESKSLGLVFGQAPSADQLSKLTQDMVWMVSTVVGGQTVLAPVVYLAASTAASLNAGSAVIAATNVNMQLTSLTNSGGVISGTDNLKITAVGDISNQSGSISGGNVALTSTAGSIINQTVTSGSGNSLQFVTDVGKVAGITSTGNLSLNAAQDIKNTGAQVMAGGDASLVAGGNVTFDTVADKTTTSTSSSSSGFMTSSTSSTSTTTVNQIKSGLTTGGNLSVKAANDITLAGTDATVGGNADLNAGGSVNLLARANSTTTDTQSSTSGLGVGGGLAGNSTTTTDSVSTRNVASTLTVGGNATITAAQDLTLLGSTTSIKGDGTINATNVNVLAGLNSDETHTTTTTTTFLKVDSGTGSSSSDSSSGKGATSSGGQGASASAQANASANAAAQGSGGLELASTSTTNTDTLNTTHVASNLNVGGNLTVNAKNDVTVVGSNVAAGGSAAINASNVQVLAAEDVSTSHTSTTTTTIGLMSNSNNQAGANANAGASADSGAYASGQASSNGVGGAAGLDPTKTGAQASANAGASASSDSQLALMKTSTTTTDTLDVTHQGGSITAGNNLTVNASQGLTTVGSSLGAGQDLTLQAKDMSFNAAQDVHQTSTTTSSTAVGLYASAGADASANAGSNASGADMSAGASGSAAANANAGVGLYGTNTTTGSTQGSTTAQVSSLSAGGNITRTASGAMTDVGTAITAGGDLNQSAATITSLAAQNTTYASDSSVTNTAKIGVYAEANAKADASANGNVGIGGSNSSTDTSAGASAGAGINASYENSQTGSSSASSTAVVSNISVGGKVNSASSGKTTLEGTNITSGGDVSLAAASLDYTAAKNTASGSTMSLDGKGEVKVDLVAESVGLSANFSNANDSTSSTTAVAGAINSGGKLNITTTGDATFTGTNLASSGATTLNSGGNVTFNAASNTSSETSNGLTVAADVTVGKSKEGSSGAFSASAGYTNSSSQSSDAVVGSISSGGGIAITSGGNATFVGTTIAAQGDTSIAAKGDLSFDAAHSTASSQSFGVDASVGASKETSAKGGTTQSANVALGGNYSQAQSNTATAGSVTSGGNLSLSSGGNTTLEGTGVAAVGQASIAAGGNVSVTAALSTSSSVDVSASLSASKTSTTKNPEPATAAKPATATATTTKTTSAATAAAKPATAAETPAADAKPETTTDTGFSLAGQTATTAAAGSISGGAGINITSGGNASFSGTQIQSGGDVAVNAAGNVAFGTANGSSLGGSIGATGSVIDNASLNGGVSKQAVSIANNGNLTVNAGGSASFAGTQAASGGTVNVNAAGGTQTQTAVSGSGQIGLTQVGASIGVQAVSLAGAGGTVIQTGAARSFSAVVAIPATLPAGTSVQAQTADGKPLPSWLSFNAATGKFSGSPPADFTGTLAVQVSVPQADGTSRVVPVSFSGAP